MTRRGHGSGGGSTGADVDDSLISDKPWELAYDTARQSFLATDIHFVRNVLTNVPADPVVRRTGPLKILVATARRWGSVCCRSTRRPKSFEGDSLRWSTRVWRTSRWSRGSRRTVQRELSTGAYQVVHFIGHGTYDELRGEGHLIFQNERAGESRLGHGALREIFCQRGLSLVFLCACQTDRGGRADFNKGVAQNLVAHGLPALVAHQYTVVDSSATLFAQSFYASIAEGLSLAQSAREARVAVTQSLAGHSIDWAIPCVRTGSRAQPVAPSGDRSLPARKLVRPSRTAR